MSIIEVKPDAWVLPDRAGFSDWVYETFSYQDKALNKDSSQGSQGRNGADGTDTDTDTNSDVALFPQQRFVRDFMQAASPYAGLVLYHGMGVGKSCAAVAAIKAMEAYFRVTVMLPASTLKNFVTEVRKCGGHMYAENQRWVKSQQSKDTWEQSDNGQEFDQLDSDAKEAIRAQLNRVIRSRITFISYNGLTGKKIKEISDSPINLFNDTAVVIDEVHNFISQVTKQRNVALLYAQLMSADPRKVILLTGTPFMNSVQELPYLVNLAHGFVRFLEMRVRPPSAAASASAASGTTGTVGGGTETGGRKRRSRLMSSKKFGGNDVTTSIKRLETDVESTLKRNRYVNRFVIKRTNDEKQGPLLTVTVQITPNGFVKSEKDDEDDMFVYPIRGETNVNNKSDLPVRISGSGAWLDHVRKDIVRDIEDSSPGGRVLDTVARNQLLLPVGDEFVDKFTTNHGYTLKNEDNLSRRIAGTVSYFGAYDPEIYPHLNDMNIVKCPMSARQFDEYKEVRFVERRLEDAAARFNRSSKMGAAGEGNDTIGAYRPRSRAIGNFVFPPDIPRPQKKDISEDLDEDENTSKAYDEALTKAVNTLRERRPEVFRMDGTLAEHSPKMYAMLKHFSESKKMSLVYSEFRRMEGIGLLSACLDANGYSMLYVKRMKSNTNMNANTTSNSDADNDGRSKNNKRVPYEYRFLETSPGNDRRYMVFDNADPEAGEIVLNAFRGEFEKVPLTAREDLRRIFTKNRENSNNADGNGSSGNNAEKKRKQSPPTMTNARGELAMLLLVTKSGAESINLKNVREVHAMEPFWNSNRINQVIFRSVRAGSHLGLPPQERHVDVFLYMSVFEERQAEELTIKRRDGGVTSDEHVYQLTKKKDLLVEQMQRVLQRSAVDCRTHHEKHVATDPQHGCLTRYANMRPQDFAYSMSYDDADMVSGSNGDNGKSGKPVSLTAARLKNGIMMYVDRNSGKMYDYDKLKNFGELIEIINQP